MNTWTYVLVVWGIYITCLSGKVLGRPREDNTHKHSAVNHPDHVTHLVEPDPGNSTEPLEFETYDYDDHYDSYEDVDLSNESSDISGSVKRGVMATNISQSNYSLDVKSHNVSDRSQGRFKDQPETRYDSFQVDKRNSGHASQLTTNLQEPAANGAQSPETDVMDLRDNPAAVSSGGVPVSGTGSEFREDASQHGEQSTPDASNCLNDTVIRSHEGAASNNGQEIANPLQPCSRRGHRGNSQFQQTSQSRSTSDEVPDIAETGATSDDTPGTQGQGHGLGRPVVVDRADALAPNHDTSTTQDNGILENPVVVDETSRNTSSSRNNNINVHLGNISSDVIISESGSNSTGSSGLNIHLPINENDPAHVILPEAGADGKVEDVPHVTDEHDVHGLNGTDAKSHPLVDQSSQLSISPTRPFPDLVSETNVHNSEIWLISTSLFVMSSLSPSSHFTAAPTVQISQSIVSKGAAGHSDVQTLLASHMTSQTYVSDMFTSEITHMRVWPSYPITLTSTSLHPSTLLLTTLPEQSYTQLVTQAQFEPPCSVPLPTIAQISIVKVHPDQAAGEDNHAKDHTDSATRVSTTSCLHTDALPPPHTQCPDSSITDKFTTIRSLTSSTSSLLPSSLSFSPSPTSQIWATSTTVIWTQTVTSETPSLSSKENNQSDNTTSQGLAESESPSSYMELKFGMSWPDFCQNEVFIRGQLVAIVQRRDEQLELTADQIQLMTREREECIKEQLSAPDEIYVRMYLLNKSHHFDRKLTLACANILVSGLSTRETSVVRNKLLAVRIHDMDNTTSSNGGSTWTGQGDDDAYNPFSDPGVIIAVALSAVGGCYCLGLVVLQVILRHRKRKKFLPGLSRSYSVTSSDSIQLSSVNKSRPNSGLFNPGLDITDPFEPSNPLTFIQLVKFCVDEGNITEEYQTIPSKMPRLSVVPAGDEDKNRYANVLPLINTRVRLRNEGSEYRSTYINANYVTGPKNQSHYYIATQAPTETTTSDFWTMVWQQGCGAIVMLTQLIEDGQVKCASYWPELVGKSAAQRHGDYLIELKHKEVHQEYIASRLEINNLRDIETREIDHFWYTCWPAVGVPEPISLVKLVLDTRPRYENSNTPLVVHCSPGTGRTCTFIALDLCMRQFEERRVVDVMRTVYVMRQERAGAIQNKEQYVLLYNSLNEYATIVVSPVMSAASSATTLHALLSS